jgi:sigma-B regulation protein RsbU (phosphoserine phosphatase)
LKVLIAEDDLVTRQTLEKLLHGWGYEVSTALDGESAWQTLQEPDAPLLVILDIMMPGINGLELCRLVRRLTSSIPPYLILLTVKDGVSAIVKGIEAGADDYLTKPFDREELRGRLEVGARIIDLQVRLNQRVQQLEVALNQVKQLEGILPICSYCKKIRNDQNYWESVEQYITGHSEARFSHGICPSCFEVSVQQQIESFQSQPVKPSPRRRAPLKSTD